MKALLSTPLERLAEQLRRLGRHRQMMRLNGLLRAWIEELVAMLPARVRNRLFAGPAVHCIQWPLPADVAPTCATLMLPFAEVMAQTVSLPAAAALDVQRVMVFEIDRYTPYSADQVHFSAHVIGRTAERVVVHLVVVEAERLLGMIEECRVRGLALRAIDALDAQGNAMGIDLLPAHLRPVPSRAARSARILSLTCLALVVAVMFGLLERRQSLVERMTQDVAEQRQQMAGLQASRRELTDTQGASGYFARLKAARPTLTVLLTELTQCLGDDTWLEQLEVRDSGELTLSGQSRHASALINRVRDCHSLQGARFQGVIQPDPQSGKDRFSLAAQLRQEAADAQSPQP